MAAKKSKLNLTKVLKEFVDRKSTLNVVPANLDDDSFKNPYKIQDYLIKLKLA